MKTAAQLQKENDLLRDKLATQEKINLLEKEKVAERDTQINLLNEQIKLLLSKRFAPSSEKTSPDQLGLFNEAEETQLQEDLAEPEASTSGVKSHTRKRKPRVSIPDALPREEIIYDIDASQKHCPKDGTLLKPIGSEDHEQLEIIPAKIKVVRHKRLTYACPCCESHLVTASKPKQPIEKSLASASLLAYVATQKYADALPLHRQSDMFKRIGIALNRTNLSNWMIKCGQLTQPLINLMAEHLQQQPYLHIDETTLQVLDEPGKSAQSKSYMWVMASTINQKACVFHYAQGRDSSVPKSKGSESLILLILVISVYA